MGCILLKNPAAASLLAGLKEVLAYAERRGVREVDVFLLSGGSNNGGVQWGNGGPPDSWWYEILF